MLSSKISLFSQLPAYVTTDVLKKFYQGYILPLIDYGSITWPGTSSANIERIFKLQNHAARIILRADFDTSSSTMFTELGWQPVHKRLKFNKAVCIYKALNGLTPEYITSLLRPVAETHDRHLSSSVSGTHILGAIVYRLTFNQGFSAPFELLLLLLFLQDCLIS